MKDLFSKQSGTYAKYRPVYPRELYDNLYAHVPRFQNAWDCATGNGQVAQVLAGKFAHVTATDISREQLKHAAQANNITYLQGDETGELLADDTFDLVTVGTALHWFDFEKFYRAVNRKARNKALLAVWCYHLLRVTPAIDRIVDDFCYGAMGPYWAPERKWVEERYRTIPFPFEEIQLPPMFIHVSWTLEQLEGYISSWSSVQQYKDQHQVNPVPSVMEQLRSHWKGKMKAEIPLAVRAGRVEK